MVMVCGGITKDGMSKSKVDPCGVCSLRVKANSIFLCSLNSKRQGVNLRLMCWSENGESNVLQKFSMLEI